VGVLALVLLAAVTAAPEGSLDDLWKDPTFQKQFMGTYGTQAEVEPKVSVVERAQLEKILGVMATDTSAAKAELQKAATPEASAVFDFTLGNLHFQADEIEAAETAYQTAVAKFPSFRRAWKNLGLIAVRQSRPEDAVKALSRVVELGGADGLTYGLLGYSYAASGQTTSSESAYRNAVLLQPDAVDWKLGLLQAVLKQRKYGEAVTLSDELIRKNPERTDLWLIQASAYVGLGQPLKAAENYEIVARMGKATPASQFTLGDIYANEGLLDLAARAYGSAVDIDTTQQPARAIRCVEILSQRGASEAARDLSQHVRTTWGERLDPDEKKKLLKIDARLAVGEGGGAEAVATLEEIVALDPLDGEALMLLGRHYAQANAPERAIFYYERAEGIEAVEADARLRHAQLLVAQSRFQDAVPLLKRAQELKPRDDVGRYLEQVERLARASR
jgi:tetratricopeptide (TPR) repeat protein